MIGEFEDSMFLCKLGMPYYGLMKTPYLHPSTSTFQTRCRADKLDTVLQHYTLAFSLEVVRRQAFSFIVLLNITKKSLTFRTISISLRANADYRTLNRNLWSWELADPMSATARHGFKAGTLDYIYLISYF
jgi:DNA (cytosine-5)-methyltransferase 1